MDRDMSEQSKVHIVVVAVMYLYYCIDRFVAVTLMMVIAEMAEVVVVSMSLTESHQMVMAKCQKIEENEYISMFIRFSRCQRNNLDFNICQKDWVVNGFISFVHKKPSNSFDTHLGESITRFWQIRVLTQIRHRNFGKTYESTLFVEYTCSSTRLRKFQYLA